jgi:hypothetical protein
VVTTKIDEPDQPSRHDLGYGSPGQGEAAAPVALAGGRAAGLSMENPDIVSEVLQEIVRANPRLNRFVSMVRARGALKIDRLKAEIALAAGSTDRTQATQTILDLLQEAKLDFIHWRGL